MDTGTRAGEGGWCWLVVVFWKILDAMGGTVGFDAVRGRGNEDLSDCVLGV